mgnify:CR=1 FL=1
MARISVDDDKADGLKSHLKDLDKKLDVSREETNTRVVDRGIETERFFQEFKEAICDMSSELMEDMKEYRSKIEEKYDCVVENPKTQHLNVKMYGNDYDYRLGERSVMLVNGEKLQTKHCPECEGQSHHVVDFSDEGEEIDNFEKTDGVEDKLQEREEKLEKDDEDLYVPSLIFTQCVDCGVVFNSQDFEYRDKFDPEKIEEAEEIGRVYRRAFTQAWNAIVEFMENVIGEGRGEWVTEYGYQYTSGAITVDLSSMPKSPKDIDIRIDSEGVDAPVRPYNPEVRMYRGFNGDQGSYPEDYKKLLDEIATLNGYKVEILGYRLNWENPEILVLKPNPPSYKDDEEVEALSDIVLPVDGQGYTVEEIDRDRVREYLENQFNEDVRQEKVESEMSDYEKAVFVEIQEEVQTKKD